MVFPTVSMMPIPAPYPPTIIAAIETYLQEGIIAVVIADIKSPITKILLPCLGNLSSKTPPIKLANK